MKRRTYAMMISLALSASLLVACGSNQEDNSSQSTESGIVSSQDVTSQGSSSTPDMSTPDVSTSTPDESVSAPDVSQEQSTDSSEEQPVEEPQVQASLTLDTTDFSLFQAGSSHTLKPTVQGVADGTKVTFQSGNEAVATVDETGKVTAVAPGTAKITVTAGDLKATCIVRCKFEVETPSEGGNSDSSNGSGNSSSSGSSSSGSGSSSSTPSDGQVNLTDFYNSVISSYEMPNLSKADTSIMDNNYAGLSAIAMEQTEVYVNFMSMNNGEIALVQVKDAGDVDKVKAIFQARIDYMVGDGNGPGGAWYPEPIRIWDENSRVVSNGNYVMMVVGNDCDAIVNDFNALF